MHLKSLLRSTAVSMLFLAASSTQAYVDLTCDVPELVWRDLHYDRIVCEAMGHIQEGDFAKAEASLERALSRRIFEFPNFMLYPRLAWVRFKQGKFPEARDDLLKAELSLSVLVRFVDCVETEEGFWYLKDRRTWVRPSSEFSDEIEMAMCSAMYESIYKDKTLSRFVYYDANLVRHYLDIKKEIEGDIESDKKADVDLACDVPELISRDMHYNELYARPWGT